MIYSKPLLKLAVLTLWNQSSPGRERKDILFSKKILLHQRRGEVRDNCEPCKKEINSLRVAFYQWF